MKYVILIYSNPASRQAWDAMSGAERADGLAGYAALTEDLNASGEYVVSEALADMSTARHVAVRDGHVVATDGPYAETKEHLAGFYLIDCANMERAVEHAARVPEAALGLVEVRPVLDRSEPDS